MSDSIWAKRDYAPIKSNQPYRLVAEGFDWFSIRCRGKTVYVPKWVFIN